MGKITLYAGTEDERSTTPDTSCELTLEKFNKRTVQDAERNNNNLHIWELVNLFSVFPSPDKNKQFKILAPKEIVEISAKSATTNVNLANVIAALNGPMAHIYIKGPTGKVT